MDRSERQQIALLAKLDEEGSVSKKALIEFGVERNPLFIRDCDRPFDDHGNPAKQSHARLRRHAIDPLQERGFVDVEQVGRVSARRRRTERA